MVDASDVFPGAIGGVKGEAELRALTNLEWASTLGFMAAHLHSRRIRALPPLDEPADTNPSVNSKQYLTALQSRVEELVLSIAEVASLRRDADEREFRLESNRLKEQKLLDDDWVQLRKEKLCFTQTVKDLEGQLACARADLRSRRDSDQSEVPAAAPDTANGTLLEFSFKPSHPDEPCVRFRMDYDIPQVHVTNFLLYFHTQGEHGRIPRLTFQLCLRCETYYELADCLLASRNELHR